MASNLKSREDALDARADGFLRAIRGADLQPSEVARGKPEPDLFLHAAAQMGVAPVACVVIETAHRCPGGTCRGGCGYSGNAGGVTPSVRLQEEVNQFAS